MTKSPKTPKASKTSKTAKAAKAKIETPTMKDITPPSPPPPPPPSTYTKKEIDKEEGSMFRSQLIFIMILAFFAIAVFWASTAELDKQVRAEGAIIPPSDVQIVQARLHGLVTDIGIELGSRVNKGDVMFKMEDKDVQADYNDNEIVLTNALIATIRLEAEAAGHTVLAFPEAIIKTAPDEVAAEHALFTQRLRALRGEIDVLQQEVQSLKHNIEERKAEAVFAQSQAGNHQEQYDMIKPLVDAGHEPRIKIIEARRNLQEAEGRAELAKLAVTAMRSELSTREKRITSVQENYRADARSKLIEAQTRLAQARSRKASLAGQVAYAEIRAPQEGTVSALHLKTVGAVVQAGTVLAEIVPEEKGLTIRANLRPENVADVYLGQEARISLSAYDVSRYGSLAGVVQNVASNTTEREGQPPFYETIITVPDPVFTKTGQSAEIIPGMTVVVDIIDGKRTVLDYILTPINKATSVAFREN
ncbi:MAG: HlyD family type I secretion periplasmic adaptor subunit [Alphaproteobacteria bacterium]|nr:HlyD family type I secretion periplasmic adaptor subunit [Alphaproteobacteria bacterium]